VLKLDRTRVRLVICDNQSPNKSIDKIVSWLNGDLALDFGDDPRVELLLPCAAKPLPYQLVDEAELASADYQQGTITIIRNQHNYGYAGGNNVGIRYALGDPLCGAIWLLNNDVVVTRSALEQLLPHLSGQCGIVGSRVLNYSDGSLQLAGGSHYNCNNGKSRPLRTEEAAAGELDYVSGCAMLLSPQLLLDVGFLSEEYFLYYEEIDLAMRARQQGYTLGYANDSIVYHQHGATIGATALADFYLIRSRLRFSRKFFPSRYPLVLWSVFQTACYRLLCGKWKRAHMMLRLMVDPGLDYDQARWGD
jgi:GT2 family glycosyltransferase